MTFLAADKVTYDHILLNKSVPVPAGTFFQFRLELKKLVLVTPTNVMFFVDEVGLFAYLPTLFFVVCFIM